MRKITPRQQGLIRNIGQYNPPDFGLGRRALLCARCRPDQRRKSLSTQSDIIRVLDSALGLQGRGAAFDRDTLLLGALPEFDSMAAVTILGALEEHFGIVVHDDEVDGSIFATVGSLCGFVEAKLQS